MIARTRFVSILRDLGYPFRERTKRTEIYRKLGGTHRIFLTTHKLLAEDYCRHILRQCGLTEEKIDEFIRAAKQ